MFCSDYPRGFVNCLWVLCFPAFDPFPVVPALPVPFLFACRGGPVSLLGLPSRPFPLRLPARFAAIPLVRLPGLKALLAPFQQTSACSRPAGQLPPPARWLFGWLGRILDRAHGR